MSSVPTFSGAPPARYQKPNSKLKSSRKSRPRSGGESRKNSASTSGGRGTSGGGGGGGFRDAWISVQALGATQLHGWKRREWEADAFEALGGKAKQDLREARMPNKMRLGIMKKRKKREERMEVEQRKADLVTGGKGSSKKGGGQRDRDKKRKQSSNGRDGDGMSDPIASRVGGAGGGREQFRNGVMRITNVFGGEKSKRRRR